MAIRYATDSALFLSTPSARRATTTCGNGAATKGDFYPRPPRGGRPAPYSPSPVHRPDFYPRPPRGGRQAHTGQQHGQEQFLSTPSARRATIHTAGLDGRSIFLSTPSARRATVFPHTTHTRLLISIHALREEGDCILGLSLSQEKEFLSTPSARRATDLPPDT